MYLILAFIVALAMAIGLGGFFNFFVVFLIAFAATLCLACFIDTLSTGENVLFSTGCKVFLFFWSGDTWGWWLLYAMPVWLFLLIGVVGGVLTAPIWYFRENITQSNSKVTYWIMIGVVAFLYIFSIVLLASPIAIYSLMHFGWIIGIFIAIAVIGIVVASMLRYSVRLHKGLTAALIVSSIGLIPMMILGVTLSMNATYYVSNAWQMRALGNAPSDYNTVFVLKNDIDFEGKDVSWFGEAQQFSGIFDGKGHTLSNIHVTGTAKMMVDSNDVGFGFIRENSGIIRNLNFKDCTFTVYLPDYKVRIEDDFYCGIFAGRNMGKISNCTITDCYIRYQPSSWEAHASLIAGSNPGNTNEVEIFNNNPPPEAFYYEDDISWKKVD